MECDDAKPKWAVDHGLKLCEQFFQGFVDDCEAATATNIFQHNTLVRLHIQMANTSTDVRLYWCKSEGRKEISFNDTPFSVNETRMLDCQFGQKYYKQKPKQGKKM